jgi:hypothetical protein
MNARRSSRSDFEAPRPSPTPRAEVRAKVKELLGKSKAFARLSPDQRQQVARDTALVADALVGKTGPDMQSATPRAMDAPYIMPAGGDQSTAETDPTARTPFQAGAAREGAAVAGEFLKQVNFVDFVSGLIDGVFHSIVTSSIEQMQAYSKMVADVAKSLDQFRDENTTEDDGKDHLMEQFPDVFDMGMDDFSDSKKPVLKLRDDVDQDSALKRVQNSLGGYADGNIDSIDVSDPEAQAKLIKAARSHIATARQQLLATMVLMGLNRIVVTTGKISAKIMYDFNASSQRHTSRVAQNMKYARDMFGNLQTVTSVEGDNSSDDTSGSDSSNTGYQSGQTGYTGTYDADYYTKGKYKYAQKPVMTAMSIAQEAQEDVLTARANLAGNVEVNFKSDYLPLDKMATPEMMAAIQMRSRPVDANRPIYSAAPAGQAQPQPGAPPPAAPPPLAAPPQAARTGV